MLLVSAPSPMPTRSPLYGVLSLAASALEAGIAVRLLDLASPHGPRGPKAIQAAIDDQRPAVIGLTIYTDTALETYELVSELVLPRGTLLVAGGPHPTVAPDEALEHGFHVVVRGEGEQSLVELYRNWFSHRTLDALEHIAGLSILKDGQVKHSPARPRLTDLDLLPSPTEAHHLVRRDWYLPSGQGSLSPAIMTSRGCEGRCVFCSNAVTGRRHRHHSVQRVIEELKAWYRLEHSEIFFFHDDAFTVVRERLLAICKAIIDLPFRPRFICEARADQIDPERAEIMAAAGCTTVILGIESGDPGMLRRIGKNITPETAESALRAVKAAGMRTQANFMLGFPDESVAELDNTLKCMERLAPLIDGFSILGILVPYPGTAIYQRHLHHNLRPRWWLERERVEHLNRPRALSSTLSEPGIEQLIAAHRAMEAGVLEAGLVTYSPEVRKAIERCLDFRHQHNRTMMC